MSTVHVPVLCEEILQICAQQPAPQKFFDGTFGRGGHTELLLSAFPDSQVFSMDRDPDAISFAKNTFVKKYPGRFIILEARLSEMEHVASQWGPFSAILLDCGISSPQVDEPHRGFSFRHHGPLDMRMEKKGVTAEDILHTETAEKLADIFFFYGEERKSRKIAKAIVEERKKRRFSTTTELATFVEKILGKHSAIHPATKIFQALRIAVNDELQEIYKALPQAENLLKSGGCLLVISFHSLEDRVVKNFFHDAFARNTFRCPSPKFFAPTREEQKRNPRCRSAKLRWGQKC